MKRQFGYAGNRGFSLVELLIVVMMMGIVTMAIYSLYESTQRTATSQDQTVELQQNLRVAMDQIARDIRMAGFMIPGLDAFGAPLYPIATANQNSITFNTASAAGRAARVNDNDTVTVSNGASVDFNLTVSSAEQALLFADGNFARIIRPPNQGNLFPDCLITLTAGPSGTTLPIRITNNSGANISSLQLRPGDIIARIADDSNNPNTVRFLREGDLVKRRIDEGTADVDTQNVASGLRQSGDANLDGLQFRYILDDGSEQTTVSGAALESIKAVRVTLTGEVNTQQGLKTRSLTSIVALRNR
ncbi:MAG TPA: prepilin-type N-terminal cleavage/methylation domain-containing protein [Desulfuromonadales bacterium]|nr:prepilin-type N-terminal cleavage/methylation domain-containing protein [Desulfuromonadales bacterium]